MNGFLRINSPGIMTTIQDGGRLGYQGSGFPASGCMDAEAYEAANVLVNNPLNLGVLEMMLMGISGTFSVNTYIAITGADAPISLNGKPVPRYKTLEVRAGDKIEIGMARNGRFVYLAVAGGFDIPKVMGSYSTNLKCKIGGYKGRALAEGDMVGIREYTGFFPNLYLKEMPETTYEEEVLARVIPGPQFDFFTEKGKSTFITEKYIVSDKSDRMGYRLEGGEIEYKDSVDILSDGIVFGSIQVPADGKPMILMADRQTTGGYAKIGTIISADLPKVAQCMPGCKILFSFVSIEEAEKINKQYDKDLRRFRRKSGYVGSKGGVF